MRIPNFLNPSNIYNLQKPPQRAIALQAWLGDATKRAFDVFASIIALFLLSPFYGLVALAIKRDSPGPVFYRGERMGRRGKIFKILKFRTMYETPESYQGPKVTAQDDARITPLGHWLRNTKLNELPQFWNVLKGEMSIVGPRPEDPTIAKTWPKKVWEEVLSVRPGVTSPASVQYRNEESLLAAGTVMSKYMQEIGPDKMRLDQLYVKNRSLALDLDVILWTALILLPRIGSATIPEQLLFVGPVYRLMYRYLRWFSIDLITTLLAIGMTGFVYRLYGPLDLGWPRAILLSLGFALLFSLTGAVMGVNRIAWSKANYADMLELLPPWFIATAIALGFNYFFGFFTGGLIIISAVLAFSGFVATRYRSRLVTGTIGQLVRHLGKSEAMRERVLIVGTGNTAQLAAWLFSHTMDAGKFWVVGFVDNDLYEQGLRIFGARVIGTTQEIPALVQKHDIGVIVVTDHTLPTQDYCAIVQLQETAHVKLVILPDMMGALLGMASVEDTPAGCNPGSQEFVPCRNCLAKKAAQNINHTSDERMN